MWVVCRTLGELLELPPDERPAPHPDRSIIVPAMAEYIGFTGKQIAMPTIYFDRRCEYLRDGAQQLQALRLAGWAQEIFCLWLSDSKLDLPSGGQPFTPLWDQKTGSDARLLTFSSSLDTAQQNLLNSEWKRPPRKVGDSSWGWSEQEAALLPDWLTLLRALSKLLPHLPQVVAVNGRRAVFPPAG